MKKYQEIFKKVGNSQNFIDPEFAPNEASFTKNPTLLQRFKVYNWVRSNKIYKKEDYALYHTFTKPEDILQGELNTCYLLSALSAMAEKEFIVSQLFPEINEGTGEVFGVWINDSGEWKMQILDNYFPILKGKEAKKFAFAHNKGPEIWVNLIEKGYAKVFGSYDKIEFGYSTHALRDLTGAPCDNYWFDDPDKCWEYFKVIDFSKSILTANSKSDVKAEDGLPSQHSFAMLGVKEIQTIRGNIRLIKLRNPWGKNEWTGDWSFISNLWTIGLRKELEMGVEKTDGVFFISIEDFIKNFGSGAICKIHSNFNYTSLKISPQKIDFSLISMNVKETSLIYITVSQKDNRHFKPSENYKYSLFKIMITKVNDNFDPTSFLGGNYNNDRDCIIEASFEPGEYLIYVEVSWAQNFYKDFVLSKSFYLIYIHIIH